MNANRRKKLEVAGWKVGSAEEFLELSDEDEGVIEALRRDAEMNENPDQAISD